MNLENMTVSDLMKLASLFKEETKGKPNNSERVYHGVKIAILQRGWVVVGKYYQEGEYIHLEDAAVIRRWGTTKGLPELVNGPTKDTILDGKATFRFHVLTEIASIKCEDSKWLSKLQA